MRIIIEKINSLFDGKSVLTKTEYFYQLIKLNIFFNLFGLPWVIINSVITLRLETFFIYFVSGVLLVPNLMALISAIMELKDKGNRPTFQSYFTLIKRHKKTGFLYGFSGLLIIAVLLIEMKILLNAETIRFLFPLFLITFIFTVVSFFYSLLFRQFFNQSSSRMLKLALFYSWKSVWKTCLCFICIVLYCYVGYVFPLINICIGHALFLNLLIYLGKHTVRKVQI